MLSFTGHSPKVMSDFTYFLKSAPIALTLTRSLTTNLVHYVSNLQTVRDSLVWIRGQFFQLCNDSQTDIPAFRFLEELLARQSLLILHLILCICGFPHLWICAFVHQQMRRGS